MNKFLTKQLKSYKFYNILNFLHFLKILYPALDCGIVKITPLDSTEQTSLISIKGQFYVSTKKLNTYLSRKYDQ